MFFQFKRTFFAYTNFLFLSIFSLFIFSCANESGGGGNSSKNVSPKSNLLNTTQTEKPVILKAITTSSKVDGSRLFIQGRNVSIRQIWVCNHEVTQNEFASIMGYNPSKFIDNPDEGEVQGLRPVDKVTWNEAVVYCNKRSIKEGFTPCYTLDGETNPDLWGVVPIEQSGSANRTKWTTIECNFEATGYRLPTEAEWEYAARGGDLTGTQYTYAGCNQEDLQDYAWIYENSNGKTHQVKLKKPNSIGLYDMSGNVYEWCWDNFSYTNGITVTTPSEGALYGEDGSNYRKKSRSGCITNGTNGDYASANLPSPLYNCSLETSHCTFPWTNDANTKNVLGLRVVRTIN